MMNGLLYLPTEVSLVMDDSSLAGQAYRNIARRLMGEDIPIMNLKLMKAFSKNKTFFQLE